MANTKNYFEFDENCTTFRWFSAILILTRWRSQILIIRTPGCTTLICVTIYCEIDISSDFHFTVITTELKFTSFIQITEIISVSWNYWNWNFLPSPAPTPGIISCHDGTCMVEIMFVLRLMWLFANDEWNGMRSRLVIASVLPLCVWQPIEWEFDHFSVLTLFKCAH